MKTISTHQEILLLTGTRFSCREWAGKIKEEPNQMSSNDQLESACWDGLLGEMLPEIVEKTTDGKTLLLWHIRHCKSFLEIDLGESGAMPGEETSIDPYLFLPALILN